ncbi:acyl-CoA desaturase [Actinoallomurus purpureus]|uniref:fatty acid desaturase family protein n=1 Tax=Actinoallomurus purpureus TaxID=478114 RepID=UPI002092B676|nr:acyl-CoA desaturase [Actinoallomurus purpureus]MCO6010466.1 acyl-CoA desaturase [Actinoallomurus purpureus]
MTSNVLGSADGEETTARGSAYAILARQVRQAGMLKRRPAYYTLKIAVNAALLVLGGAAFVLLGRSWYQLFVAAFFGIVFTQVAFIGHDAGHRQIAGSRRMNDVLGLVHGNLLIGLSYGWWVAKHNRHHANPNHEGRDPDISSGAIAFTTEHALARRGRPARTLARFQAYLFFPMLLIEAMHLHVASVRSLLGRGTRRPRSKPVEALLLGIHLAGYLAALLAVLSPVQAAVFVVVHQCVFGLYLGCAFAPNHKGMLVLSEGDELDFLRRQVLTSRNIRGGRFTDFILGGLNYQIEHHLFPSMPRPGLRRVQGLVRAHCGRQGLTYHESSLVGSYAQVLRHLNAVGAPLRPHAEAG